MSKGRVYVLGGGVAGLAAATALVEGGQEVTLIEAAPHAGGRCRSFFDKQLQSNIDNGNHLVLSGNTHAMRYLARIDALDTVEVLPACFSYKNIATGEAWSIDLGTRRYPWHLLWSKYRIPGTRLIDYWRSRHILSAKGSDTITDLLSASGVFYEKFWVSFAVSVLNTSPDEASAALLMPVVRETFGKGGAACRPVLAKQGLGFSFVDPAIEYLKGCGVDLQLGKRCRSIDVVDNQIISLDIDGEKISLEDGDIVISALPPSNANDLLPMLTVPNEYRSIVNGHFKIGPSTYKTPITGLLGGFPEWLFIRGDIASVTISAADASADEASDKLAHSIWQGIAPILGLNSDQLPPHRIIKEKRATIAQTPRMVSLRPKSATNISNLLVAGDWTDTGLPATIEGAIQSGHEGARLALNR